MQFNEVEVDQVVFSAQTQRKFQVQTRLCSLSVTDEAVLSLYRFMETDGPRDKIASMLRCITKTKGQVRLISCSRGSVMKSRKSLGYLLCVCCAFRNSAFSSRTNSFPLAVCFTLPETNFLAF